MHFVFFVLLAVLLSNSCLKDVAASKIRNGDNMASSHFQILNENLDESHNIRFNFTGLITDVQYEIMDLLDTEDVMNVMEAFPNLSPLGISIYKKRYKNLVVAIRGALSTKQPGMDFLVLGNPREVCFRTHKVILKALKHFGCVIQRLSVDNRFIGQLEAISISQHINEYTSSSLIHLNLNEMKNGILDQFTKPFENVESLNFIIPIEAKKLTNRDVSLDQIFPKLYELSMELWADADYSFLQCKLPILMYLDLNVFYWKKRDQIDELIRNNPQIQGIDITYSPNDYVKFINEQLPNLENISMFELKITGNDIVQFEHVTHFSFKFPGDGYDSISSIKKLSFPRLNSLKIQNYHYGDWATVLSNEFLIKHPNISRLHYVVYLPCDDLLEVEFNLPNLTEILFECPYYRDSENVITFLGKHEKLTKFEMKTGNGTISINQHFEYAKNNHLTIIR